MGQPITIERAGPRVYFAGDTYAAKDRIKALGGHWDGESRRWWVGLKKLAEAEALVAGAADPKVPRAAVAAGLGEDTPAGVVADKLEQEGRSREAAAVRAGRDVEDPRSIRLTGKGTYKGRAYYLGASTRDGKRVRLLTLPDDAGKYLDFWADAAEVRVERRYEPREERGHYGRSTGRLVYQTLGSIAAFVRRQQDPASRRGPCSECGHYGPSGQPCSECGGEGSHA